MDRESIERLAMDRAAGELTADAEALLASYLAEHSESRAWAAAAEADYRLANKVIKSQCIYGKANYTINREYDTTHRSSVGRPGPRGAGRARSLGKWAAVVLAAAGAGWWAGQRLGRGEREVVEVVRVVEAREGVPGAERKVGGGSGQFWRERVLASVRGGSGGGQVKAWEWLAERRRDETQKSF